MRGLAVLMLLSQSVDRWILGATLEGTLWVLVNTPFRSVSWRPKLGVWALMLGTSGFWSK